MKRTQCCLVWKNRDERSLSRLVDEVVDQDRILFGIKKDWIGNKFKEKCKKKENKYVI